MWRTFLPVLLVVTVTVLAACYNNSEKKATTTASAPSPTTLLPHAAFTMDVTSGAAPLIIRFVNQSVGAERFEWDFGDGQKSIEPEPPHSFTKVGRFQVRLTAYRRGPTGEVSNTFTMANVIEVAPGRLSKLVITPLSVIAQPLESIQLSIQAEDEFGNLISTPEKRWTGSPAAKILSNDVLQVGTKTGQYPQAVQLEAGYLGGTAIAAVNVEIIPGPVSLVTVTPAQTASYTGDPVAVKAEAYDNFGNGIVSPSIIWSASDGSITSSGSSVVFRSGRAAKSVVVTAQVSDGHAKASSSTTLQIQEGTCQLSQQRSRWTGQWYELNTDGSRGSLLGSVAYDLGVNINTWGEVYGGRSDRVVLDASAQVLVQRTGPIWFQMEGDDGFQLLVDNKLVIDKWRSGRLTPVQSTFVLPAGLHTLHLKYFEDVGEAILHFYTDSMVAMWNRTSMCTGTYSQLPSVGYFITSATSADQVADRFGLTKGDISPAGEPGLYLSPGAKSTGPTTKVIFLQGMGSRSGCDDISSGVDSLYSRMLSVLRYAQSNPSAKPPELNDFIGFSYTEQYAACNIEPFGQRIELPRYGKDDTCIGVIKGARYLDELVRKTRAQNPSARIVLIGHSLGGLVATYWASSIASPELTSGVANIITVESPLLGDKRVSLSLKNCSDSSPTVQDLSGASSVVPTLSSIGNQALLGKIISIKTSSIGDAISGSWVWIASCSTTDLTTLVGTAIGAILCPWCTVAGFMAGYAVGESAAHSCAFFDDESLTRMAAVVSGGFPPGFRRQP